MLGGTGVMEAGGFVAILGGQLLAGVVAPRTAGLVACALAVLGLGASFLIPRAPPVEAGGRVDLNVVRVSWRLVGKARAVRPVWLSILAIAWFYAVGAVLLGELVPLVQGLLHARQEVAVLFLAVFSVGVAAGSLLVDRLLKGAVSARFVPASAFLLAGLQLDLALAVGSFHAPGPDLTLRGFLALPAAWRILFDLAALSVSGGVFVIPLYAVLQTRSPQAERSRILAANNIVNAGVCVAAIAAATVLLKLGVGITGLVALMGAGTLLVALYACVLLPEFSVKPALRAVLRILFRVEATGLEHVPVPAPGAPGAVVVANHVSYLDAALLAAFLPGKPTFAVHTRILAAWWMRPVRPFFDAFPVDMTSPLATRAMVKAVRAGRTLVIFPEGRISVTGGLMKVFAGPAVVADKAGAPLVPVRLDGPERSPFSLMRGKTRRTLLPRVRLAVLPPVAPEPGGPAAGRRRRAWAADRLYDVMTAAVAAAADVDRTLFQALLAARDLHGARAVAVEDAERRPLSYGRLAIGARLLGRALEPGVEAGEAVGLMLPNVNAALAAFFALQARGRVPAMLNYTAGSAALEAACDAAAVRTVVTSRAFVEKARLEAAVARLEGSGRRMVWLEDAAAGIGAGAKLLALLAEPLRPAPRRRPGEADETAVILFTSGSEGAPKGVALSHRNLLANCAQVGALIAFDGTDRVFNALPLFHSFGLTGGTLLPMLGGVRVILYPNPLHYAAVPAFAYDADATILFGSDTFLAGYARRADPYDFRSVRYVFAGAERVREETRATYADKFGLRILGGLRRHRVRPGDRGQLAPPLPRGLRGPAAAADANAAGAGGGGGAGRPTLRARPQRHARLPARRPAGRDLAPPGRLVRHGRRGERGHGRLRHPARAHQALRQGGRRNGVAGRRRGLGGAGLAERGPRGVGPAGPAQGRAAGAGHHPAERGPPRAAGLGARPGRGRAAPAARGEDGGRPAGARNRQDRLSGAGRPPGRGGPRRRRG